MEDAADAAACQAALGGPVAVKLTSPDLRHKSEIGAFELNVDSPEAASAAYARLRALDAVAGAQVLVERMAAPGVELLVSRARRRRRPSADRRARRRLDRGARRRRGDPAARRAPSASNGSCAACAAPRS